MITVADPVEPDRLTEFVGGDFLWSPKRVTFALQDQGGAIQVLKMSGSQLLRLANRMEGVAQTNEARNASCCEQILGNHAGNPATKRLAGNGKGPPRSNILSYLRNNVSVFFEQIFGAWRWSFFAT